MKLYELQSQYLGFLDLCTDPDSDISAQVIKDTIEGLEGDISEKVKNIASMVAGLEAEAAEVSEARIRIQRREKALNSRIAWLRDYATHAMQATGIKEVKTPEFRASLVKNPVSVAIAEGAELHPAYIREKLIREPDKAAIKEALQNGATVPGCSLQQTYRLSIR